VLCVSAVHIFHRGDAEDAEDVQPPARPSPSTRDAPRRHGSRPGAYFTPSAAHAVDFAGARSTLRLKGRGGAELGDDGLLQLHDGRHGREVALIDDRLAIGIAVTPVRLVDDDVLQAELAADA